MYLWALPCIILLYSTAPSIFFQIWYFCVTESYSWQQPGVIILLGVGMYARLTHRHVRQLYVAGTGARAGRKTQLDLITSCSAYTGCKFGVLFSNNQKHAFWSQLVTVLQFVNCVNCMHRI